MGEERTEDWVTTKMRDPAFVKGYIDELEREHKDDLRLAVTAERERILPIAITGHDDCCPYCGDDPCVVYEKMIEEIRENR